LTAWVQIPGGEHLLGLTADEARRLATLIAEHERATYEPDPLHGFGSDHELEHRWGNVDYLTGQLAPARPAHPVRLEPYAIAAHPVTVGEYAAYVAATGTRPPKGSADDDPPDLPVTGVSWHEADGYARWRGCALPSEAQWERAARGTDRRLFPWGDAWSVQGARLCAEVARVKCGMRPAMASPDGVHELVTFLFEWCADSFGPYPGADAPLPDEAERTRRGGAALGLLPNAAHRQGVEPGIRLSDTTFRLVRLA
jgi:formylglycine-generating enzyme required for sulfatase activity